MRPPPPRPSPRPRRSPPGGGGLAAASAPPPPGLRDNGPGRRAAGSPAGPRQRAGTGRGGAALPSAPLRSVRRRRRLPGALPASPRRQAQPARRRGRPASAPGGRGGTGWLPPAGAWRGGEAGGGGSLVCVSSPPLPGRSGGRRCVPPLPAEPAGMGETGTNRSGAGRVVPGHELCERVSCPRPPGFSPGVVLSCGLRGVRRVPAGLWEAVPGSRRASCQAGRRQIRLSKGVAQGTSAESLGLLVVCVAGQVIRTGGF